VLAAEGVKVLTQVCLSTPYLVSPRRMFPKGDRERSTENLTQDNFGRPTCKDSGSQKNQNCDRRF
jgi:hypothetical protein